MSKSDQVKKIILEVDGEELPGLVNLGEYSVEDDVVDVPGRDKVVPVRNGVKKIPHITATYKIARNSQTYKFLKDWYYNKEVHEITCKNIDGTGKEFARELWHNVEVSTFKSAAYDAAAPVFAQVEIMYLPEDIIPVEAE